MGQGGRGNFSTYTNRKLRGKLMDLDGEASSSGSREGYIVHEVSRLDTLAGVAIKYGVEVADIKKLNGLTTDIQMFARKSLRIPLPGRHPPSDQALLQGNATPDPQPRLGKHSFPDIAESILLSQKEREVKKKESPSIGLLRGYYGLSGPRAEDGEGTEMEVINGYQSEDEPFTPREHVRKPKFQATPSNLSGESKVNSFVSMARDFVVSEVEKAKMAVRRRPKGDYVAMDDPNLELLADRAPSAVRHSVPRPKPSTVEVEVDYPPVRAAVVFNAGGRFSGNDSSTGKGSRGGKVIEELIFKLKKSSSTPILQEDTMPRNGSKSDLASLVQVPNPVTIPLLDTFTRRSKAALD